MENARRTSLNTGWVLSDCILADAFVLTENEPDGIYVQSVTISTHIVAVVIGSVRTGAAIGTASTVRGQDRQFASKPIHGLVAGVSGYITFGSALSNDRFVELRENAGMHLFSPSVMLEPRTVIDTGPFPVRSIGRGDRSLSGQIRLRTNSAMSFDVSQGSHNGTSCRSSV